MIDARAVDGGFDPPQGVEVRRREMALRVAPPAGERVTDFLNRIKPWAQANGFEEMYVQ